MTKKEVNLKDIVTPLDLHERCCKCKHNRNSPDGVTRHCKFERPAYVRDCELENLSDEEATKTNKETMNRINTKLRKDYPHLFRENEATK
jgi:hypothetical protein